MDETFEAHCEIHASFLFNLRIEKQFRETNSYRFIGLNIRQEDTEILTENIKTNRT